MAQGMDIPPQGMLCMACSTAAITRFKYSMLPNAGGVLEVLPDTSQLLEAKAAWHGFTGNSHCAVGSPRVHQRTGTALELLTLPTAHRGVFLAAGSLGKPKLPLPGVGPTLCAPRHNRTTAPQLPKITKSRGNPNLIPKIPLWSWNHSGFQSVILLW